MVSEVDVRSERRCVGNLGHLEHFVCSCNHLFEAMDRIPYIAHRQRTRQRSSKNKMLTEFCLDVADEKDSLVWVEPLDVGGHDGGNENK